MGFEELRASEMKPAIRAASTECRNDARGVRGGESPVFAVFLKAETAGDIDWSRGRAAKEVSDGGCGIPGMEGKEGGDGGGRGKSSAHGGIIARNGGKGKGGILAFFSTNHTEEGMREKAFRMRENES